MKYHIEKNTVQETLVIPLFGRLICSERFPELFSDPEAKRICDNLDYDFADKRKKMESAAGLFGALEVAQRQYDLRCEVENYLKKHPKAAVVNLGCGLDDPAWMDQIDASNGAVFFAAGVFYYFRTAEVQKLFHTMAEHFPGGVLVFDACNRRGYRDIYSKVGMIHKLMIRFCDGLVRMKIVKIAFKD